jgi:hypothetical protein
MKQATEIFEKRPEISKPIVGINSFWESFN